MQLFRGLGGIAELEGDKAARRLLYAVKSAARCARRLAVPVLKSSIVQRAESSADHNPPGVAAVPVFLRFE